MGKSDANECNESSLSNCRVQLALSIKKDGMIITPPFTHHTIRTHALIVLSELHLVAHQWLYFLFKLTLTEALEEIATSISKQARLNDEHAFNICLYYLHFMFIIDLNIVKRVTKIHPQKCLKIRKENESFARRSLKSI